jgi:Fe-Mn family superoxide dismutase
MRRSDSVEEEDEMAIELPALPFDKAALAPHMSAETVEFHYGKHHKGYVEKLNSLIEGTRYENQPLEEIIRNSEGAVFNNAAQIWNHTFFWHCLSPNGGGIATGPVASAIERTFGNFDKFKATFTENAVNNFGSGWTWLVQKRDNSVAIVNTGNAQTPLTDVNAKPLLTVDVWEHAYYIDYRNQRPKYLEAFWNIVNWNFVNGNL